MKSRRAYINVYDHTGVRELAEGLAALGYRIFSFGKTAEYLKKQGIEITALEEEPADHMGCDVVAVNFRPFKEVLNKRGLILDEACAAIETGAGAAVRSAAKSWHDAVVLTDPQDYPGVLESLSKGGTDADRRYDLACKVFEATSAYDALVASYMRQQQDNSPLFPESLTLTFDRVNSIRYGENPHQRAAFYRESRPLDNSVDAAEKLSGGVFSYNNLQDTSLAVDMQKEFSVVIPCAVIVKHMNPCGVGLGERISDAFIEALEADTESVKGGSASLNREIDPATAERILECGLEAIVAPSYAPEALALLKTDPNLRILSLNNINKSNHFGMLDLRKVAGGLLVQELDTELFNDTDLKTVTHRAPNKRELNQMLVAWRVAKHAKTQAIVLVRGNATVGVGAGQTTRRLALELALRAAGAQATGSVLASEADLAPECAKTAIEAGVAAIIQPGGSETDPELIALCDEAGVAMVFTGMRHFRH